MYRTKNTLFLVGRRRLRNPPSTKNNLERNRAQRAQVPQLLRFETGGGNML